MTGWQGVSPELATTIETICTRRQTEILQLVARGYSTSRIARTLDLNRSTVREHLDRATKRLRDHGIGTHHPTPLEEDAG